MSVASLTSARDKAEAAIDAVLTDPQPSYSAGGRTWSHDQHLANLTKVADDLNALIIKRRGGGEIVTSVIG